MNVRSIADLPFRQFPAYALLGFDAQDRDDYTGFGYCRVKRVVLSDDGDKATVVENALILALHSLDDAPAHTNDIELEFVVDDELSFTTMLSTFLSRWLPQLVSDGEPVVLALCNPNHATIPRPPELSPRSTLYVGIGDVTAWMNNAALGSEPTLGLSADHWNAT